MYASRRNVLGTLTAVLTGSLIPSPASASASSWTAGATPASVKAAVAFLNSKFDEYGSGSALRVPRSYTGGVLGNFVSSFAYDDALVIMAWLAHGDVRRATILGDTLLHVQKQDPIGDGRTRASYQPETFEIGSPAAFTGNQAWVGMAFAQLYARTHEKRFLDGALREATWIQDTTWDGVRAPYGYTGGRTADDEPNTFKATEHNIDVGAFFTMLARLTGRRVWLTRARAAFAFVAAMQDRAAGHVWTGTGPDGTTTNRVPIPSDVQTWARLATGDRRYDRSVTWVLDRLAAFDATIYGVSYSDTDTSKVWLEGTAHTALALQARGGRGDALLSRKLLWNICRAQATTPNGDGRGVPAASSDGLDTGFGDLYYASLHTGATAWYLLAALGRNPFRL
ncbi:hypothetical protein ACQP2X_14065 [Actinoplanes sp. CA-131856]